MPNGDRMGQNTCKERYVIVGTHTHTLFLSNWFPKEERMEFELKSRPWMDLQDILILCSAHVDIVSIELVSKGRKDGV